VEEEVMLLDPRGWRLAQAVEVVLPALPEALVPRATSETHSAAVELATGVHARAGDAVDELAALRGGLRATLEGLGLAGGVAGTHPFAVWQDMIVTPRARHQLVSGSMRALARREPTFALHVHVAVADPDAAVRAANRMRAHLPVLLALSANSPFWQGRDTGLASARTPLFQAFPRVGIPRVFGSYQEYVEAVDLLVRCDAFPDPTYLWWDVRLQPRFGTVEVRVMDAQGDLAATRALVALTQCLVRLEATDGLAAEALVHAPEALDENRFLAARDGAHAAFVDPVRARRVPLGEVVDGLLEACAGPALELGCADDLGLLPALLEDPPAERQRRLAGGPQGLPGLVATLAARL
jgi:carboxylate-amine ligase